MITIYEVMKHVHNFFIKPDTNKYGTWKIENGALNLPFLSDGQYFLTDGSLYNDEAIHQNSTGKLNLTDEEFIGYIVPLYLPSEFVDVCGRISTYMAKNDGTNGTFNSESFGGYSYSKGTHSDGTPWSWKDVFKQELDAWRKL